MSDSNNPGPFQLGLCMAGAVSAGAYTAGVMDFLLEALERWEEEKRINPDNTPRHQVTIPVMGGASAGGMTALIAALLKYEKVVPIRTMNDAQNSAAKNKLFDIWVNLDKRDDTFAELLRTDDIKNEKILSLLNSKFIDRVADRVTIKGEPPEQKKTYFKEGFKVFATMSNLNGFKKPIVFSSNTRENDTYHMSDHRDYGCFQEGKEDQNGWMAFDFDSSVSLKRVTDVAKATGAFPMGLASRYVTRPLASVLGGLTKYKEPPGGSLNNPYTALFVDGGMINNEPFTLVKELLCEATDSDEEKLADHCTSNGTVLMIDPFPSEGSLDHEDLENGMLDTLGSTFSAIMQQIRLKHDDLQRAVDTNDMSQFLMAPTRYGENNSKTWGKFALACGALGGFSGFLSKEFRLHDFFMGRRNCQYFLQQYFTFPENSENPIIQYGYQGISNSTFKGRNGGRQIIPIFDQGDHQNYRPVFSNGEVWPRLNTQTLENYKKPISNRINAMMVEADIGNWVIRKLAGGKLSKAALKAINDQLMKWDLLE